MRNNSEEPHGGEGKLLGVGDFTAGPARYRISGATKVIRSVMHPAWSNRPPLVKQNKRYLERFIEISFGRKPACRPVQRRVVRIPN